MQQRDVIQEALGDDEAVDSLAHSDTCFGQLSIILRTRDSDFMAKELNLREQNQSIQRALEIPVQSEASQHFTQVDVAHQNLIPPQGRVQIVRLGGDPAIEKSIQAKESTSSFMLHDIPLIDSSLSGCVQTAFPMELAA